MNVQQDYPAVAVESGLDCPVVSMTGRTTVKRPRVTRYPATAPATPFYTRAWPITTSPSAGRDGPSRQVSVAKDKVADPVDVGIPPRSEFAEVCKGDPGKAEDVLLDARRLDRVAKKEQVRVPAR